MQKETSCTKRALLVVDVFSHFRFKDGPELAHALMAVAPAIASAIASCRQRGETVIFCNDNFQRWHDDWKAVIAYTVEEGPPQSGQLAQMLYPSSQDIVLLKSRHSAFYNTQLMSALEYLHIEELGMAGAAADACVFSTAVDAHVRKYNVEILVDAVASATQERLERALVHMSDSVGLTLTRSEAWGERRSASPPGTQQ